MAVIDIDELLRFASDAASAASNTPWVPLTLEHIIVDPSYLAALLRFAFPSLTRPAAASWTLCDSVLQELGVPRGCIDVAGIRGGDRDSAALALAVLYFFHAVSRDPSFQAEFAVEWPAGVCDFLESPQCEAVLLRGGAYPAALPAPDKHAAPAASNTNRQLEFTDSNCATPDPAQSAFATSSTTAAVAVEGAAVDDICESLRAVLHSYADMVDAALGSPELSASSRHRHALRAGLAQVDALQQAAQAAQAAAAAPVASLQARQHRPRQQQVAVTTPLPLVHALGAVGPNQNFGARLGGAAPGCAVQLSDHALALRDKLVIRAIQERDRALTELAELRERHGATPA